MLVLITVENGVKKIIPLTADAGAGNPVGSLLHTYKKSNPSGYLYCDGSTFDQTKYPLLYAYLGTNVLPDYRECVEVGAEQNATDTIATHDVYTEGQFKDDQIQDHTHSDSWKHKQGIVVEASGGSGYIFQDSDTTNDVIGARTGTTTHGKQKAVFVYIKATSGLSENAQDNVINTLNEQRSYSTSEVNTGKKYINGKDIYSKTYDFGYLPNNTTKTMALSITNLEQITKIEGVANKSSGIAIPLPFININNLSYSVGVSVSQNNIEVQTGYNYSEYFARITIEYTKTN